MKRVTIFIVFYLLVESVSAQTMDINRIDSLVSSHKEQVADIDNMKLYKTQVDYHGYRLGPDNYFNEWLAILYFDTTGILRKSKLKYFSVGDEGYHIRYYGLNKEAIHSTYSTFSGMNGGYSASRYLDENGDLLFVDFIYRDDDRNGQLIEHIIRSGGYDLAMPLRYGDVYDKVINIDSLKSELKLLFKIDSLYMPEYCLPVKFARPIKGDTTIINQNSVPFYSSVSKFVEPIRKLDVGHEVIVLGIKKKWYKVRFEDTEGYVSAEFLAPVEKILGEITKTK